MAALSADAPLVSTGGTSPAGFAAPTAPAAPAAPAPGAAAGAGAAIISEILWGWPLAGALPARKRWIDSDASASRMTADTSFDFAEMSSGVTRGIGTE